MASRDRQVNVLAASDQQAEPPRRELPCTSTAAGLRSGKELLQELKARQAELEAQVEELRRSREDAELGRALAEEKVANRELHYSAMINSFEGLIYICSPDHRIEFMNERMKERTGRDATGETCYKALHELDLVCPWCVNDRIMKGDSVHWDVKSPKDGRWYHISNTPIHHPDGTISKQALITDITERKLHEERLQESTETLRILMDMMPIAVSWNDYEGKVEYLNHRFVEQFGYTKEEVPSIEELAELAYPDPAKRNALVSAWWDAVSASRSTGRPIPAVESKVTCRDGSVRQIIRHTELARNRILNIYIDVTERDQIQAELLKGQKLESLGVLAGGIAHDFNNVLTSVLGNISFARLVLTTPDQADQMLENAEKASQRAVELARQLLTFAKGGKPVKTIVSVQQIVKESATLMLRGSNVRGELRLPELDAIEADEGQISQVCNNIVLNAVQAMPEGGTLTIEAENVTLDGANLLALPGGDYVRVSFTDQGCGIDKENLNRIFDPYFTTKATGTGLGLASTVSIIRKHGGHLGVRSELGKGTTFVIHLPSKGVSYASFMSEMEELGQHCHPGGAILIMDDDGLISGLASGMMEFWGYSVTSCNSGERAVQLFRAAKDAGRPFVAVIMDLTVPGGMGGKEAAAEILAIDPAARLIVSSGYSNDPVLADYRSYGFFAALPKPYRIQELEQVLAAVAAP